MSKELNYRMGIVSYNIHYNFTNYGSVLQTYALQEAIKKYVPNINPIIIDYCPPNFIASNPKDPLKMISSSDYELYKNCEILMPDILANDIEVRRFIKQYYNLSEGMYTQDNFEDSYKREKLDGYICGSDAIWSVEYFKRFDDAFYANYQCMRNSKTISYAASFGETDFNNTLRKQLIEKMYNFKAIAVRENTELETIRQKVDVIVERVVDPTLLLSRDDYEEIMEERLIKQPYLLLYSRKYNREMYCLAEEIASQRGLKIVEISLQANNMNNHILMYRAGIEEFLSLIKYADFVITNSLHGSIFSVIMEKDFWVFPRIHGDRKIDQFLELFKIGNRKVSEDSYKIKKEFLTHIDYQNIRLCLNKYRRHSIEYLRKSLAFEEV